MDGQMTIFDYIIPEFPDFHCLTEKETAEVIGNAIGIQFTYNNNFKEWEYRKKGQKLTMQYSHYTLKDNQDLFISAGWSGKLEGCGSPCDSIEEAVCFFKNALKR